MARKQLFAVSSKEESLATLTSDMMDSKIITTEPGLHLTGREAIGLGFYFDANNRALISYEGDEIDVVVPTSIGGVNVSIIKANAFITSNVIHLELPKKLVTVEPLGCDTLQSVKFNEGLLVISDYAFANNKLRNIVLPDSLDYCGAHAFYNNQLESVSYGKTDFGPNPFTYNMGIKFESRSTKYNDLDGTGIYDLVWSKVITCTDPKKIPITTKIMGQYSLSNTTQRKVNLPYGVVALDDFFILNSSIEEIYVPPTVTVCKEDSFSINEMLRGHRGAKVLGPKNAPLHIKSLKDIYEIQYCVV